jgi:hypothetical protein
MSSIVCSAALRNSAPVGGCSSSLAIVIGLINASNLMVRWLLPGADSTTLFLIREVVSFLISLLASGIMGRIEGFPRASVSGPPQSLTAAFFCYSHHSNSGEDWVGLLNVGAFGLLACLLLRRTGNLWMPIGFHTASPE